jgi:hypothetical protein
MRVQADYPHDGEVKWIRKCLAMGDRLKDIRDRALLLIGFAGALRRSELVGLDVAMLHELLLVRQLHLKSGFVARRGPPSLWLNTKRPRQGHRRRNRRESFPAHGAGFASDTSLSAAIIFALTIDSIQCRENVPTRAP